MVRRISRRRLLIYSAIPFLDAYAFWRIGVARLAQIWVFVPELVLFLILLFFTDYSILIAVLVFAPWKAALMYKWTTHI